MTKLRYLRTLASKYPSFAGTRVRPFRARDSTRGALLALALAFHACAVDERPLEPARHFVGGAGKPAGVGHAGADAGGTGAGEAAGGAPPSLEGLVDGCADLDTDGIADCTTTLVENASFASHDSAWTAETGSKLSWDPKNALGDLPSGSGKLSSGMSRAAASQCVALAGGELVIAYANAWIEADDGSAGAGGGGSVSAEGVEAELMVSFFDSEDCSGETNRYFETPPSSVPDAWTTIQAGGLALATTRSASIALVGIQPAPGAQLIAYFDNVMLKARTP